MSELKTTNSRFTYLLMFVAGVLFGIVAIRSELSSWYRIYEMFRFQSFHMYGIIGSAVVVGAVSLFILKKIHARSLTNKEITVEPREPGWVRFIAGGTIFGLGWGLIGMCPGPIYALVGKGYPGAVVVLLGAVLGTYLYGFFQKRLPH